MKQKLTPYESPKVEWEVIELESSIAQSSTTISGGENLTNEFTPAVDSWGAEQSQDSVRGDL
ncbi:hypothetical protein GQF61_10260 [Sphingobacterium sp. DK4209]|uniref:Uncharacterized protein n=1 Tax=Sphingobacterium zhuxiongii TaxID=2662364 RepID=A0A5Q0Q4J1_9SPHI|nr:MULTISPECIES: hypothetical protein [unclassified Sphingobacterium]MVZ66241.1 hypothetical protein [Sphingobacterium sp. DK4209]QGA24965.1 hypothetical protein GFH32_00895 [Sphingobacterium sp. dk4302]